MVLLKIFMPFVRSLVHHDYDISPRSPSAHLADHSLETAFGRTNFGRLISWRGAPLHSHLEGEGFLGHAAHGYPKEWETI